MNNETHWASFEQSRQEAGDMGEAERAERNGRDDLQPAEVEDDEGGIDLNPRSTITYVEYEGASWASLTASGWTTEIVSPNGLAWMRSPKERDL